jgi:putative sterol carrier protein
VRTSRPLRPPPAVRDLEFRCRFDDFVDVVAGRLDPRKAMATGRLRPKAKPRALWRARGLFTA